MMRACVYVCMWLARQAMLSQLDMTVEARNLVRFRANFADRPDVAFPQPYLALTSRDVLVESLEVGQPMRHFTATQGIWNAALGEIGISSFLQMTLVHNFVVSACWGARPCRWSSDAGVLIVAWGFCLGSTPTCTRATCSSA
jgi:hypothetical protein